MGLDNKIEKLKKLRECLDTLWAETNESSKKELIIVFMDSIDNLLEEKNVKQHQVDIIEKSMIILCGNENITENVVDHYMKFLIENDIPIVLLPAGISEMYY